MHLEFFFMYVISIAALACVSGIFSNFDCYSGYLHLMRENAIFNCIQIDFLQPFKIKTLQILPCPNGTT